VQVQTSVPRCISALGTRLVALERTAVVLGTSSARAMEKLFAAINAQEARAPRRRRGLTVDMSEHGVRSGPRDLGRGEDDWPFCGVSMMRPRQARIWL
jgi:hypothetical protein